LLTFQDKGNETIVGQVDLRISTENAIAGVAMMFLYFSQ
jgi:hypothetical protein